MGTTGALAPRVFWREGARDAGAAAAMLGAMLVMAAEGVKMAEGRVTGKLAVPCSVVQSHALPCFPQL